MLTMEVELYQREKATIVTTMLVVIFRGEYSLVLHIFCSFLENHFMNTTLQ